MKRALAVLALVVAAPGCMMTQYRQQGIEYSLGRTAKARDGIVAAAEAGRDVAEELASAAVEKRPPEVARPMERLVVALSAAHEEADEAGKTLAVMQEDLGRPQTPAPPDPESADAWRMQYRAASRLWKMAMSWARSNMPFLGKIPGSAQAAPGGGWTPGEIAGLVTAMTAALAGLGEATRRGVKSVRARIAEKDAEVESSRAETDEAMQALDEVKQAHPDAVKAAADRQKRPNLRRAYVRREVGTASSGDVPAGNGLG